MKRWVYVLPVLGLLLVGLFTALQLIDTDKPGFAEATSRPAPDLSFPVLEGDGTISFGATPGDQPIAVNLFASWCAPCRAEHDLLVDLSRAAPGQLYGIAYKDAPEATRGFLAELGNPFTEIGVDLDGQGGLDFGLTGVPETFVIDPDGTIILHVRGPLDEGSLARVQGALAN